MQETIPDAASDAVLAMENSVLSRAPFRLPSCSVPGGPGSGVQFYKNAIRRPTAGLGGAIQHPVMACQCSSNNVAGEAAATSSDGPASAEVDLPHARCTLCTDLQGRIVDIFDSGADDSLRNTVMRSEEEVNGICDEQAAAISRQIADLLALNDQLKSADQRVRTVAAELRQKTNLLKDIERRTLDKESALYTADAQASLRPVQATAVNMFSWHALSFPTSSLATVAMLLYAVLFILVIVFTGLAVCRVGGYCM